MPRKKLPKKDSVGANMDLLATIPAKAALSADQRLAFAKLWSKYGDTGELWKQAKASGLSKAIPVLKRTLALSKLTGRYVPLMRALQTKSNAKDDGTLRPLAALKPNEWIDLVYEHGAPAGVDYDKYIESLQAAVKHKAVLSF